jgi:membrane protease YdiL (CAAX protease family)
MQSLFKLDKPENKRTLRNLIIFVIGIIAIPWLGWSLDVGRNADPHDQQNSLGWLLFILAPMLMLVLLRTFAGDGWKDAGLCPDLKGNVKWYVFALLFHPISMSLLMLSGFVLGVIIIPDLSGSSLRMLGQTMLLLLGASIVKNIFEEFGWRGYLAPKLQAITTNSMVGHILAGLVWFTWHLPYYLVLMSPEMLHKATSFSGGIFLVLTFIGLIPTAVLYGELRIATDSVWPAVLIHTTANVFFDALVMQKFFSVSNPLAELFVSPGLFSLLTLAINISVGLWLYRRRMLQISLNLAGSHA